MRLEALVRVVAASCAVAFGAVARVSLADSAAAEPRASNTVRLGCAAGLEANRGQAASAADFIVRSRDHTAFVSASTAVFAVTKHSKPFGLEHHHDPAQPRDARPPEWAALTLRWAGSDERAAIDASGARPGRVNYLVGRDPSRWLTGVPLYGQVRYRSAYPGIDLVYRCSPAGALEYDLVVWPGADPGRATLEVSGAERLEIHHGSLIARTAVGVLRQHPPRAYQDSLRGRVEVTASYELVTPTRVALRLGAYDTRRPLVIDPVITYATYLGGSSYDEALGIAVGADGSAYVAGRSASVDFPGAPSGLSPASNVFVAKLAPDGSSLVYTTYFGGSGEDVAVRIAVDPAGHAYVTGSTDSHDFPTTPGSVQPTYGGNEDAFVAKLAADGRSLAYSTYLGTFSGTDRAHDIAVDAAGSAVVAGTASPLFPMVNAVQPTPPGPPDAFVARLNPAGSALVYSTFVGGSSHDYAAAVAIGGDGRVYVAGTTWSPDLPVVAALQPMIHAGGYPDVYVAVLAPGGSSFTYLTYLGGTEYDEAADLAVDAEGRVTLTGRTYSRDFPVWNAVQPAYMGTPADFDAFVTRLSPEGDRFEFSTYLGGLGDDRAHAVGVNLAGETYVTGRVAGPAGFPVVNPTGPASEGANIFVAKLTANGAALAYSTLFGGNSDEAARDIAVGPFGSAYVAGWSASADFPTVAALQPHTAGEDDAIVLRIDDLVAFKALSAQLWITGATFRVKARFAPAASGEILVGGDPMRIQIGPFSVLVPVEAFARQGQRASRFTVAHDGSTVNGTLRAIGGGRYRLEARGYAPALLGVTNDVRVGVAIGDDGGEAMVRARLR